VKVVDIPIENLREAPWNPNRMDEGMLRRLRASVEKYGVVHNLVVRPLSEDAYEVLSGNQRLKVLQEAGFSEVPCVIVAADDAKARMLAQALNRLHGEDDLGMRAELLRDVLAAMPADEVVKILPETPESLAASASLGQESLVDSLRAWENTKGARLHHCTFQLTSSQSEVVEKALARVLPKAKQAKGDSPNDRGTALYILCQSYLKKGGSR
jgi:ParB family chromosome partitioning protein